MLSILLSVPERLHKPLAYVGAALLLIALIGALWARGSHYRDKLDDCRDARKADRAAYVAAQDEAQAKAKKAKADAEARYRSLAEKADAKAVKTLADARAAAERHIAANRVRPEAVEGAPGRPASPAHGGGAEGADGPGAGAELVAVHDSDVMICTENTARLLEAREWGLSLNP